MINRTERLDNWQIIALAKAHQIAGTVCGEADKKYHKTKYEYFRSLCAPEMSAIFGEDAE